MATAGEVGGLRLRWKGEQIPEAPLPAGKKGLRPCLRPWVARGASRTPALVPTLSSGASWLQSLQSGEVRVWGIETVKMAKNFHDPLLLQALEL